MNQHNRRQLNKEQIEACLKSATLDLMPDVLDQIDLSTPQEDDKSPVKPVFAIRQRVIATLIAACFCMIALAGGTYTYQNGRVDSVIGIDVNPSVELSVNRSNRVLSAKALNEDARNIMDQMDLKGVDLNVAVNAVIGSMVTHGYLTDVDNAILVTVANDSVKKAKDLRFAVVNDIQSTLEERQLKAVVYDQQVVEEDSVKKLASEYDISYGKAYFLRELIAQNQSLTIEDMKELSSLSMEEIARVITERSYAVGGKTGVTEETTADHKIAASEEQKTESRTEVVSAEETAPVKPVEETQIQTPVQTTQAQTIPSETALASSGEEANSDESNSNEKVKIDYVDYENGLVMVNFKTKVKWKNPTVSVKDQDGTVYSAKVSYTDSEYCEINVTGLEQGKEYTFLLGGVSPKIGKPVTIKGVFETPVVGDSDNEESEDLEESEEIKETKDTTNTSEEHPVSSVPAETVNQQRGNETTS
ncbi:hypothetical protein [Clostridium sp. HBUAS56010]|uniref:anti-sigma-I factor RsgI family protein n=1 Tax=Clostridium sp. HBUAS56010 TaxID=2571127 RepID=UPI001177FA76|nr:hypothetical protein [Clostridium sp. HBUAS56010]